MLFKKIHDVINVHFIAVKHDIFLSLQYICCAFSNDLTSEGMRGTVQKVKEYGNFMFCLNLI